MKNIACPFRNRANVAESEVIKEVFTYITPYDPLSSLRYSLTQHVSVTATTCFGLSLDHHQMFAVTLICALCLTYSDNYTSVYCVLYVTLYNPLKFHGRFEG
jgi:hypothetical protein